MAPKASGEKPYATRKYADKVPAPCEMCDDVAKLTCKRCNDTQYSSRRCAETLWILEHQYYCKFYKAPAGYDPKFLKPVSSEPVWGVDNFVE
ncbi:hypothetical protein EJ06DRAFT_557359 [Trichodelitschia bisporula]|uniref:MYND-type domain-containing protein n=1 Tax=Trichodelitschia bisporula TaxID=703511 RepID=A0A6G1HU60_9PEZI|nr:hypothetical protein EJ06DRAFT_557359 [Trichodelitschia bisporula]